ncbi:unannotated protein [freshwater metagenome]|uniref:Unannotated protein n=1 Tax=freshwater metagenome TaxID=449393 RepID=A0A6J7KUL9_9ZZZZ
MAVKCIGNEGSHADALISRDVLAGADVLGHALRLLYDTSAEELQRLIRWTNEATGLPRTASAAPRDRPSVLPRDVTSLFSDREGNPAGPPPSADINPGAWRGLCALMRRRVDDGSLAKDHPLMCLDKPLPYAVNTGVMFDEWGALVPGLDLPLRSDEPPTTAVAMDALEWVARHVWTPQQIDFHTFMGHTHLRHHNRPAALKSLAADANDVLSRNGVALRLTDAGKAERTGPAVVAARLHAWDRRTGDDTLDDLLAQARRRFLDPDPAERTEALKALWAAWERVKSIIDPDDKKTSAAALLDRAASHPDLRALLKTEARALTNIGNAFSIRHSETSQVPLETEAQADWLFARLWALVELVAPAQETNDAR